MDTPEQDHLQQLQTLRVDVENLFLQVFAQGNSSEAPSLEEAQVLVAAVHAQKQIL